MRLAFLYGKFSIGGRPFDLDNLYSAPRGLTGSELSCVEYALAMKARGHDVTLLLGQPIEPREWRGLKVLPLINPSSVADCDAVLAWNEPNLMIEVPKGPLRIVNQQLNDFAYCAPGWEAHVDVVTSPSAHHLAFLQKQAPGVAAWEVVANGCDPSLYHDGQRVSGRVIWASSADRGLHRLLEAWPEIKRRAPHASLRAFYNFQPAPFDDYEQTRHDVHGDLLEIAQRKRYIRYAMGKLAGPRWDVEHVGSVSRERIVREWEAAEVLGYPCDTIRYTEGFSVTTMEACASGCLPVITDVDALGDIYGGAAPMVALAGGSVDGPRLEAFVDLVVRGLTDAPWRAEQVERCRALAARHAWPVLADGLESMIARRLRARVSEKKAASKTPAQVVDAGRMP